MDKHIRRTVTITIVETWTITWADGAAQTVVYHVRQPDHMLPASLNEPQSWIKLEIRETNSSLCAPIAQTDSRQTTDGTG